jgi:flagellin FlaB
MMMNKEINNNDNEAGAIGIGAMIVFIALILVAAVASAVIIQTGEKLQQNAQQAGSDTQAEISGKIMINNAFIYDQGNSYLLYFESAPGSGVLDESTITYSVTCSDTGSAYQYTAGTFTATKVADNLAGADIGAADIQPGVVYAIILDVHDATGTAVGDCSATSVGLLGEVTLWIHVPNGGSTYETLLVTELEEGALVV